MNVDPIVLAVPFYFVGITVEIALSRWLGRRLYAVDDTFSNLACGLFQQLLVVLAGVALTLPYVWFYEHFRVTNWFSEHTTLAWWLAFVGSDFFYYWFHRWSHESAIGWFSHVVHHQSEFYNLSVALRQDAWQPLFSLWFQLPLAIVGVPPAVFATAYALMIVYQFWIHTQFVGRLGPLEWVLNTPSHHRVHHGVDPSYLDKNYAGVFIVWDKVFGTFEHEARAPSYGTIEPLGSFNPVWSHFAYGKKLWLKVLSMPDWVSRVFSIVRSPGWQPRGTPHDDDALAARARLEARVYSITVSGGRRWYSIAAFVASMALGVTVLVSSALALPSRWALAVLSVWGLGNAAGVAESKPWARPSERLRLIVGAAFSAAMAVALESPPWWAVTVTSCALALALSHWLDPARTD